MGRVGQGWAAGGAVAWGGTIDAVMFPMSYRCMGQEGVLGPSHAIHAIMAIHPYGFVSVRIIATTALGAPMTPEFVKRVYDDGAVFLEPSLCLM